MKEIISSICSKIPSEILSSKTKLATSQTNKKESLLTRKNTGTNGERESIRTLINPQVLGCAKGRTSSPI